MTQPTNITPADIETKIRDIQSQVEVVADDSRRKAIIGGLIAAAVAMLIVYLIGRSAGRRTSSVVEIRRI